MRELSQKEQENLDKLFSKQNELTSKFFIELILGFDESVLSLASTSGKTFEKPVRVDRQDGSYVLVGPVTKEHLRMAPAYEYLFRWIILSFGKRENSGKTITYGLPINTFEFLNRLESEGIFEVLTNDYGVKLSGRANSFFQLTRKNQSSPKDIGPMSTSFRPLPKGTAWEDLTITLVASDTIVLSFKGRSERISYHELGMSDKRKGDYPKREWWVLVLFLKENGFVPKDSENFLDNLPEKIKPLKKTMKKTFGIDDDIFCGHYKKENGYRVKFKTGDKTQISYRELLNLPLFHD